MSKDISLRSMNKARTKLSILNNMLEMVKEQSFEELNVSDICEEASISRVTFYNYFPKKEDLLVYLITTISFHFAVKQLRNPKRGKEAILALFDEAAEVPTELILTVMRYLSTFSPTDQFELSAAERALIYPEQDDVLDVRIRGIGDLFITHLKEAMADGEISAATNPYEMSIMLNSILFGAALSAHMYEHEGTDIHELYRHHLDVVYKGLQGQ